MVCQRDAPGPFSMRDAVDIVHRNCMLSLRDAPFDVKATDLVSHAGSCADCPRRAGNQPELFADVKDGDTCTDPRCFQEKRAAHNNRQRVEAEAKGWTVISGKEAKKLRPHSYSSLNGWSYYDGEIYMQGKTRRIATLLDDEAAGQTMMQDPHNGDIYRIVPSGQEIKRTGWSPDGRSLAVTLSRDGGSQLFVIDANGGEPRRLTQSAGIDTEPVFAPDGSAIYFVSDRGGAPQIYRMPASGGPANRVTFNGTYNISPAISPDGRWLTYISRIGGAFKLHVMDIASGNVAAITDSNRDERPSFAPNSRLIVYATIQDGREALMTTTLDGRIKARLSGQGGDLREPNWGPFSKILP